MECVCAVNSTEFINLAVEGKLSVYDHSGFFRLYPWVPIESSILYDFPPDDVLCKFMGTNSVLLLLSVPADKTVWYRDVRAINTLEFKWVLGIYFMSSSSYEGHLVSLISDWSYSNFMGISMCSINTGLLAENHTTQLFSLYKDLESVFENVKSELSRILKPSQSIKCMDIWELIRDRQISGFKDWVEFEDYLYSIEDAPGEEEYDEYTEDRSMESLGGVIILPALNKQVARKFNKFLEFCDRFTEGDDCLLQDVQVFVAGEIKEATDKDGYVSISKGIKNLGDYFSRESGNSSWINADIDFSHQGLILQVDIPKEEYDLVLPFGRRVNYEKFCKSKDLSAAYPEFLEHRIAHLRKTYIKDIFVYKAFNNKYLYSWAAKSTYNGREYFCDASGVIAKTPKIRTLLSGCDVLLERFRSLLGRNLSEVFKDNQPESISSNSGNLMTTSFDDKA